MLQWIVSFEQVNALLMEILEFGHSSSKFKWLTNRTYWIGKIYWNLIPLFDWLLFSLIIIQMSLYYVPPQSLCALCIITCWRFWAFLIPNQINICSHSRLCRIKPTNYPSTLIAANLLSFWATKFYPSKFTRVWYSRFVTRYHRLLLLPTKNTGTHSTVHRSHSVVYS